MDQQAYFVGCCVLGGLDTANLITGAEHVAKSAGTSAARDIHLLV
jgi:hypothetical protein